MAIRRQGPAVLVIHRTIHALIAAFVLGTQLFCGMRPVASFVLSSIRHPHPSTFALRRAALRLHCPPTSVTSTPISPISSRYLSIARSMKRPFPAVADDGAERTADPPPSDADARTVGNDRRPLVIVIAGPTGVGKSSVAMSLCKSPIASQLLKSCGALPQSEIEEGTIVGNIVSADSVQAYRGVQVGANKPTQDEREECPHHLIDVVGADDLAYNAADWMRDAMFAIDELYGEAVVASGDAKKNEKDEDDDDDGLVEEEILKSRRTRKECIRKGIVQARSQQIISSNAPILPVVVGGTMMYLQWLVHGRPDAMRPTDDALERAANDIKQFQEMDGGTFDSAGNSDGESKANDEDVPSPGWDAAVAHASSLGKPFKARVDKLCGKDWYRLRRILEVFYTVGAEKATQEKLEAVYSGERFGALETRGYDVRCFFLCPDDRMKHAEVIDRRCEDMLLRGLLNETASLSVAGELPDAGQPARAIGYRQTLDYLRRSNVKDQDDVALNAFMDEFTTATRRYAKKQMGWFRKDGDFMFIPVSISKPSQERVEEATNHIVHMCQLKREEYEKELYSDPPKSEQDGSSSKNKKSKDMIDPSTLTLSARTKFLNEKQGKDMKFYKGGTRYQITKGSSEHEQVLAEADASTSIIQGS